MAIALYVPPEYGPINQTNEFRNNSNRNIPRRHRSHVVPIVDSNNNTVPDILQNLNSNNPDASTARNELGFFNQLGFEIMSVFRQLFELPQRRNYQSSIAGRNRRDNQRRLQADNETQQLPLPDLLQYEVSLDLSIESSSSSSSTRHNHIAQDNSDVESSSGFELKVSLNYWEGVGRELRRVGDQFQYENSFREEELPSYSMEIRLLLKIAVPTFAIIGLGGLYCLRKLL